MHFCESYHLCPIPASENTMLLYVTYLYLQKLKYGSIRVYISAVRSLHVESGLGNPFENYLLMKQAIRALQINGDKPKQKLPITIDVLRDLYTVTNSIPDGQMLWAVMTMAFYGCLRASEFTISGVFDPNINLCIQDVTFYSDNEHKYMSVLIKRSKTDVSNKGFTIYISCVPDVTCAVCAMSIYISTRISQDPHLPLFLYRSNLSLKNSLFRKSLHLLLSMKSYSINQFSGHSFRIGCATTAASVGLQDFQIKLLGRWTSDAYHRYIRATTPLLLNISSSLIQPAPLSQLYNFRNPYLTNLI